MNLTALPVKKSANFKNTFSLTLMAILCALSLSLSFLEINLPSFLVLPPGAKPGFSNIVSMFVCSSFGLLPAITIIIVKSLFTLIMKGFTAFLMSLCGGILSVLIVYAVFKLKLALLGAIGTGIIGALFHNIGQLSVAFILTSKYIFYYTPFLVIFAIITGSVTGFIFKTLLPKVNKIALRQKG